MNDLPNKIRAYRTAKSLTANDFGRIVGIDRQGVYSWERSASPTMPSPRALYRLADLGIITVAERDALIRGEDAA